MTELREKLEQLQKQLRVEKTQDFMTFKSAFFTAYDFEKIKTLARQLNIKRTGSRSTTWKMLLGTLPPVNDYEQWISAVDSERKRFEFLHEKYIAFISKINIPNPLASLVNSTVIYCLPQLIKAEEIVSMKDDRDVQNLIRKDVERTMQEVALFKDKDVQRSMEEILYIWAKEYPEFKYQQGMNEILAVIVICLTSELIFEEGSKDKQASSDGEDEEQNIDEAYTAYLALHNVCHIWSDAYSLFERLMNLGVKELYYREVKGSGQAEETKNEAKEKDSLRSLTQFVNSSNQGLDISIEKEKQNRLRKQKLLELNQEDAQRTALKKRSNKIFNNYLKEIDSQFYYHIQDLEVQPEIILLKWLRCLLSREFTIQSLLEMWDYMLSSVSEEGRHQSAFGKNTSIYEEDSYFVSHSDFMMNLDYVCLAMLQMQRKKIMEGDYMDCLKIAMTPQKLSCSQELVKISERIKKILHDKQVKPNSLIEEQNFPRILEKDVENFMLHYSLEMSKQEEEEDENESMNSDYKKKCFKVKEEEEEEDDEEEDIGRRIMRDKMNGRLRMNEQISERDECEENEERVDENHSQNDLSEGQHTEDNFQSFNENDQQENSMIQNEEIHPSNQASDEGAEKKTFKIKNTKGKVVYDHATKQKKYMSPFDQFLSEQQELFKVNDQRMADEQNSVTMTTTASTTFENKNGVLHLNSSQSGTGSVHEEPINQISQPKPASKTGLASSNKLAQVAMQVKFEAHVKTAEDMVMEQRKDNLKQLKQIKSYLTGVKTGMKTRVYNSASRSSKTKTTVTLF